MTYYKAEYNHPQNQDSNAQMVFYCTSQFASYSEAGNRYIACHGVLLALVLSPVYFLAIVSIQSKVGEFENKCQ